ncbi:hypothetical protein GALMADRAFT_74101 [Galerina marginata CBS 339.88]|uniref:Uncharacterized protein n=1 Tax=Galerina marginata (strain CBS 339.88) TaxID=685588 RepID=A0A067T063_GALM3|nr:hypothetical protein GALMADRAFT_74101 [Galerina marginata CBS 339.88]
MSLTSGNYTITTRRAGYPVGRNIDAEDSSLRPKKVVILGPGVDRPWAIEKLGGGIYTMKTRHGAAADIESKLFAVLIDEPEPTKWRIEPQFNLGKNLYIIGSANRSRIGWNLPVESEKEIGIQVCCISNHS